MSLVADKLKQIADKEKAMVIESLENMANHFVTKALSGLPPITNDEWHKRYTETVSDLKKMMESQPEHFKMFVDEYVDDLKAGRVKASTNLISDETMRQLGMLTPKTQEIASGASKAMSSKLLKSKAQVSEEELGIFPETPDVKPQRSMLGKMFASISERLNVMAEKRKAFDIEKPKLDTRAYMKDEAYRANILTAVKEIAKLGSLANKDQKNLVREVKRLNEEMRQRDNPRERMTAGGQAMYDITKAVFGMGKGLVNLLRSEKKPGEGLVDAAVEAPQEPSRPLVPEKKVVTNPDMPLFSRPLRQAQVEPAGGEVSWVMGHGDEDSADVEEQAEIEAEYREETLANEEKQIELLEGINQGVKDLGKKESSEGGEGFFKGLLGGLSALIMKSLGDLLKSALTGLATRLLPMIAGILGPALLPLAGIAAVVGTFMLLKKATSNDISDMEPEEREKFLELNKEKKVAEANERSAKYWEDPAHSKQREAMEKAGFELVAGKWLKKVEGVKKEVAPTLEVAQAAADEVKAEKESARLASNMSQVINSPTNTVVTPQAPSTSKRKDSPRNPNTALTRYLDSRITKFA